MPEEKERPNADHSRDERRLEHKAVHLTEEGRGRSSERVQERAVGRRSPGLVTAGLFTALVPTLFLFSAVTYLLFIPLVIGLGSVCYGLVRIAGPRRRATMKIGLTACALATIGPFAFLVWANQPGTPIVIVLPNEYHGKFSIVLDSQHGAELRRDESGWVFEIPNDGVLRVKDTHPFHRWHKQTYVHRDGRPAKAKGLGMTTGTIRTGSGGWRGSAYFDGTTHRFVAE